MSDSDYFELFNCISLKQFDGQRDEISCAAFSADADLLVVGCEDRHVRLFNTRSSSMIIDLEGHSRTITSVAVSPTLAHFASASADHTIRLHTTRNAECVRVLTAHKKPVQTIVFMHDALQLLSGSWDKTIRIWDVQNGACLLAIGGHASGVESLAIDSLDVTIASGCWDTNVYVWYVPRDLDARFLQRKPIALEGHRAHILSVAFSTSNLIASGSADKTVIVWEPFHRQLIWRLEGHGDWVRTVSFSPDAQVLASAALHDTVRFWNIQRGTCARTYEVIAERAVLVSFTEAGTALVTTFGLTAAAEIITYMWQTLRTPLEHPSDQLAGASASASCSEPGAAEGGSDVGSGSENGSGDASEAELTRRGSGIGSVSGSDGEDGAVEGVRQRRHSRPHDRHVSFDEHAPSDSDK